MTRPRRPRPLSAAALALSLALTLAPAAQAPAQNMNPNEEQFAQPPQETSSGDPWIGSAVAIFFGGIAVFIVAKSARRSMSGA